MTRNVIPLMDRKLIRPRDIEEYTGISKSTVYRLVKSGKFPKQCCISERCRGWRRTELDIWMEKLPKAGEE